MAGTIHIKQNGVIVKKVLLSDGLTVGRCPKSDVHLDNPMVSAKHARFSTTGSDVYIEDLGSTNGIIYRGSLVDKLKLHHGIVFEVSPYTVEVSLPTQQAKPITTKQHSEISLAIDALVKHDGHTNSLIEQPKSLASLVSYAKVNSDTNSQLENTEKTELELVDGLEQEMGPAVEIALPDAEEFTLKETPPANEESPNVGAATLLVPVSATPRLYPLNFKAELEAYNLDGFQFSIGRLEDCHIKIQHPSVSKHHASLRKQDDDFILEDLGSANGTRVNGELVNQMALRCHDVIEIGDMLLEYLEGAANPQARSNNVIEIAEDSPEIAAITKKPKQPVSFSLNQPLTLTLSLLCLFLLLLPFMRNQKPDAPLQTANVALNSPIKPQQDRKQLERKRIVEHQLNLARNLLEREKYDEAKIKVALILNDLDPNNLEAQTMRKEIQQISAVMVSKQQKREEKQRQAQRRIKNLMSLAGAALDEARYDEAKSLYRQVLGLRPNNKVAKERITAINRLIGERADAAKKSRLLQSRLKEVFTKGMVAYNSNNLVTAAKHLREITKYPNSTYYSKASIALDDVEEKLVVELDDKLNDAREQYVNGQLVVARSLLQEILTGSPSHQEALALKAKVLKEAREEAQKLFREGYTFERLVQDSRAAKDRYQKVMELLPESSEEYHKKARQRLNSLN